MKGCRPLTSEEIKAILDKAEIREKVLFLTGLNFGTRINESLNLTFGDVAGKFLSLKSSKNSDNQVFPIPDGYKAIISELKSDYESKGVEVKSDTKLFLSQKSLYRKAYTRQQASRIMSELSDSLGFEGKINTHSLRKSFVSKIYELTNFNIAETQTYSRHKSLSNLQYYISTTGTTEKVMELSWT